MQALRASLKPGIWGVIIGSILTMIVGFSWGGWTPSSTARQQAMIQADTAVTTALGFWASMPREQFSYRN